MIVVDTLLAIARFQGCSCSYEQGLHLVEPTAGACLFQIEECASSVQCFTLTLLSLQNLLLDTQLKMDVLQGPSSTAVQKPIDMALDC